MSSAVKAALTAIPSGVSHGSGAAIGWRSDRRLPGERAEIREGVRLRRPRRAGRRDDGHCLTARHQPVQRKPSAVHRPCAAPGVDRPGADHREFSGAEPERHRAGVAHVDGMGRHLAAAIEHVAVVDRHPHPVAELASARRAEDGDRPVAVDISRRTSPPRQNRREGSGAQVSRSRAERPAKPHVSPRPRSDLLLAPCQLCPFSSGWAIRSSTSEKSDTRSVSAVSVASKTPDGTPSADGAAATTTFAPAARRARAASAAASGPSAPRTTQATRAPERCERLAEGIARAGRVGGYHLETRRRRRRRPMPPGPRRGRI